ncbi:hypothetical protein AVEN_91848-1 [Araneus ventricosus]|uniref:Uncharacterized protein n=1 Tax=Araneus ventricosus TaxID=182803 RepID=A0A4Y2G579_ARAVE|nr:hypothetical protein AVEN_91848-1 [Araneus ventricosus]
MRGQRSFNHMWHYSITPYKTEEKSAVSIHNHRHKGTIGSAPFPTFSYAYAGRGSLVARSRLWGRRFQARNPIPLKIRRVWGLLHAKSYVVAKRPPVGVAWKFGEGVPAQVSSSSSDHGSKLQGPSEVR